MIDLEAGITMTRNVDEYEMRIGKDPVDRYEALSLSVAISLKRIADAIDALNLADALRTNG